MNSGDLKKAVYSAYRLRHRYCLLSEILTLVRLVAATPIEISETHHLLIPGGKLPHGDTLFRNLYSNPSVRHSRIHSHSVAPERTGSGLALPDQLAAASHAKPAKFPDQFDR
jgi:hypothetical protein